MDRAIPIRLPELISHFLNRSNGWFSCRRRGLQELCSPAVTKRCTILNSKIIAFTKKRAVLRLFFIDRDEYTYTMIYLLSGIVFILGIVVGSFINALEYRITEKIGINGRSFLSQVQNISWLV